MMSRVPCLTLLSIVTMLAGCGGAQPESETKAPEKPPSGEESTASGSEEPSAAADEKPEGAGAGTDESEKTDEPTKGEAAKKPAGSLKDILTAEGSLFSFSFSESEVYQQAQQDCSEKADGDAKKKADCMAKAGSKIEADSILFKKEPDGKWTWITMRRAGAKVTVLHKFEVEFGEETDTTITLKPKGRDKGTKPMTAPAKVVLEVSDSGIVLNDPKLGKMVYVRKLGAVGDPGR